MKKLLATITLTIIFAASFSACSLSSQFANDLLNAKKEATEAVENLTNEATEAYEAVETKVDQFNQAAESISNALDAIQQAKEDIGTLTSSQDPTAEEDDAQAENVSR